MGANIASPLEQQFMQIPGIEMITSRNSMGLYEHSAAICAQQKHRRRGD